MNKQLILISIFLLAASACTSTENHRILAKVEHISITVEDLQQRLAEYDLDLASQPYARKEAFKKNILNELIEEEVFLLQAKKKNISVSQAELNQKSNEIMADYSKKDFYDLLREKGKSLAQWKQQLRHSMIIEKLIENITADVSETNPEKLKALYQNNKPQFTRPESYQLAQIVVKTKEKAKEVLEKLKNGEEFSTVSKNVSITPEAENGGYIGIIPTVSLPKSIFDGISSLEPKQISGAIESTHGLHIVKLIAKIPEKKLTFEEALPQIKQMASEKKKEKVLMQWKRQVFSTTKIERNDELFKSIT